MNSDGALHHALGREGFLTKRLAERGEELERVREAAAEMWDALECIEATTENKETRKLASDGMKAALRANFKRNQ